MRSMFAPLAADSNQIFPVSIFACARCLTALSDLIGPQHFVSALHYILRHQQCMNRPRRRARATSRIGNASKFTSLSGSFVINDIYPWQGFRKD